MEIRIFAISSAIQSWARFDGRAKSQKGRTPSYREKHLIWIHLEGRIQHPPLTYY